MPSRILDASGAQDASGAHARTHAHGPGPDRLHVLADGRRLGYREYGSAKGLAVIALHGTPGSRMKFAIAHDAACALGLRLICPDRWGYGLTDAPPMPSLAAYGNDMAQLATALGVERFGLFGISGGGPFAAAVAASIPGRVAATALVAPVGQVDTEMHRAGVSQFHRFCFRLLPRIPGATAAVFSVLRSVLAANPAVAMKIAGARACASDRMALADPATRLRLAATFRMGLAPGVRGPMIDMALFARAWDLDLASANAPARGWIGTADKNVPVAAASRLIIAFPQAELTVVPDAGHFWITRHYADVLAWLADQMDRSSANAAAAHTTHGGAEEKAASMGYGEALQV